MINFGSVMGSKDPMFGRRYCTFAHCLYCMDLRPLLIFTSWPNITPRSRHRTNDKNALINMTLSMGNLYSISWRESPDTSTVYNNEDKRNHPHHLFSHCVSYSTYQDPRVSVNTSGNLILCCKPQICCLALRAASHILGEPRVDSSFWKKGGPSGWAFGGLRLVWAHPEWPKVGDITP